MNLKNILFALSGALLLSGCAMHSTSKDWNGLVGASGEPTYYKATSKVAVKLFIVIPLIGDVSIDGMIDDMTEEIALAKGNYVSIVQADSENYWYGYPPFTWIITPVINTVAAEYRPDALAYKEDQAKILKSKEGWKKYNPMEL